MSKRRRSVVKFFRENHGPSLEEFHVVQNGLCALCGHRILSLAKANFDHVKCHSAGGKVNGNVLLTHTSCNSRRQSNDMGPVYVEILDLVNERLGWNGKNYTRCVGYSRRLRELKIIDLHDDLGIDIKKLNKYWYVRYPGMADSHIPALSAHFGTFLKNAEIRGLTEKRGKHHSFRLRHDGLK